MSCAPHRAWSGTAVLLLSIISSSAAASAASTLMRFPTASPYAIAFVAHGDLWTAPRDGGRARRLVQADGDVSAPRLSPDGAWVAYTQRSRGGQDVWVAPASGGPPRRLTHDARAGAADNLVVGWTPDGRRVLFLSTRMSVAAKQVQAFSVPLGGGPAVRLPLDQSGRLDVSPTDGRIAYTRTFTDLALRKRYLGGMAEDVFVYDAANRQLERITDWKGTDAAPMWAGRRLYFLSDRGAGFRMNLWCYDPDARTARQVTRFADADIDWPSLGGGRIVFQQAGRLWALELDGERLHALRVDVPDDGARTAPRLVQVGFQARPADVTGAVDYAQTPDGGAALVAAHGDIFRVDVATGAAVDLTLTPTRDEDHPAVSPDGRTLAYVTEDGAAQQIAVRPIDGGAERVLTRFTDGVLYTPLFSSDGRKLAVADAEHRLWLVPTDGGDPVQVARDPAAEIRDAVFSPDGRWLAYSTLRATGLRALHLHSLVDGRDTVLSGELDGDRLPAFSADGTRLYFVSQRHDYLLTGDRGDEASLASVASDGLYSVPLDVAPDQIMRRAVALPVTPGRIATLESRGDALFYETRPLSWIGGDVPGSASELHRIGPAREDAAVLRGFDDQIVAADGRHLLFRRSGDWRIASIGGTERRLDLAAMRALVNPRLEWREMFEHAWKLDRDLFFSRVMNGTDWSEVHRSYARLLGLLGLRADAQWLIGQMQGELATSHAFMGGLDADDARSRVVTGRLGADLALDPDSGRYRFAKVFTGDPTRERFRAPLYDPANAVDVSAGDYLLAIDGVALAAPTDPDELLIGKAGRIKLTIAARPDGPRRDITVVPLTDDLDLRQHDWVEAERMRVATLSGGRIGYVFLGDFAGAGSQDLDRQLQGQIDRDGLVLDLRWNRGGYTSQAVLGLLRRRRVGDFVNREGALAPLPLVSPPQSMAVVVNAQSASDGDQFPYFFRLDGLGPIVGQRTWGGVQGIRGPWPLMDGTTLTVPKDSLATPDGHWIIENEGVVPDIAVDPDPDEALTGRDRLLETATAAVSVRLRRKPAAPPRSPSPLPAYPPAGDVPGSDFGAR